MEILSPNNWQDYELIDCGDFEKLERFGKYILQRPEPQAIWKKALDNSAWMAQRNAVFEQKGSHSGLWNIKNMPDHWYLRYRTETLNLKFKLALTSFKHVGLFPEQAVNWDYIHQQCTRMETKPKVLNLFAYTGAASLAAKQAGADVVHVDSVKQVISWANENMELSKLKDIRWTLEDALKFVKREAKRNNMYEGIILDPPAYGIGVKGERWKLEDQLDEMLGDLAKILNPEKHFFILNSYSLGLSSLVIKNLLSSHFPAAQAETGEIFLASKTGFQLPLGVFGRFANG